jgi:hypothetical protein
MEVTNDAVEVRIPKPLDSQILIKNPITTDAVSELEELGKKLPEKEKKEYYKKQMSKMMDSLEVVSVGPDVKDIEKGDKLVGTEDILQSASPTPDSKFLFVRRSAVKGKW